MESPLNKVRKIGDGAGLGPLGSSVLDVLGVKYMLEMHVGVPWCSWILESRFSAEARDPDMNSGPQKWYDNPRDWVRAPFGACSNYGGAMPASDFKVVGVLLHSPEEVVTTS